MARTIRICSVPGCGKKHRARGYCDMHLMRLKRYGRLETVTTPAGAPLEWIEAHVSHDGDECLIWPFSRNTHGYAHLNYEGQVVNAARVMCKLAHGDPENDDLQSLHSCGKGHLGCVNPKHLRWGTQADNEADKIGHGTYQFGENNPSAKLTADMVIDIRRRSSDGVSSRAIAAEFGINDRHARAIVSGQRWGHL